MQMFTCIFFLNKNNQGRTYINILSLNNYILKKKISDIYCVFTYIIFYIFIFTTALRISVNLAKVAHACLSFGMIYVCSMQLGTTNHLIYQKKRTKK